MSSKHNVRPAQYIDNLPDDVYEITHRQVMFEDRLFNRYWWDPTNNRLIMKTLRGNKYKIVQPIKDKYHDGRFVYMIDIHGNQTFVNFDGLLIEYSVGYYLKHLI